jgi:hypothetical protein
MTINKACMVIQISQSVFLGILGTNVVEIWVLKGFFHRNPSSRVKLEQLQAKIKSSAIEVLKIGLGVDCFELGECWFKIW